jgi:PLP dependent protein
MNQSQQIEQNYLRVIDEVHQACRDAGRAVDEVTVVAASKYVDAPTTAMLVAAGCRDLGENRPQSLWDKADSGLIDDSVQWHLIGHLQSNKTRRLLRRDVFIHSVDSPRILNSIAQESVAAGRITRVLLELNVSGDETKTGMTAEQIESLLASPAVAGVSIEGLMAMAGLGTDIHESQRQFAAVREFRDSAQRRYGITLKHLSMGMSGDFAPAIREGATLVRIGSRLFES